MHLAYTVGAIFALSLAGFAQTVGQVTGVVTDPSGSIVVGATVTITNSQTNVSRTTTTNGAGNYAFPALQPKIRPARTTPARAAVFTEVNTF